MNKYLSSGKDITNRLKKFEVLLKTVDGSYLDLIYSKYKTGGPQSVAGLQEIFTLAGINPYTIYKDIKASKEKKIATLVGYIKEMRLKPLSELTSATKPKQEEKDKKDKD
ncbi:hypothetical protein [Changchengzhania lutea]|uniref:hypothetical protein n=1 Tax=Changchengzhania lutea TaxID=2049305 RepID=UPI00115E99AC|nr:hypothetical protein [Changchengzhania lutea]